MQEDVEAINGIKGLAANNCFDVADNSTGNVFTVFQRNAGTGREVTFLRGEEEIKIARKNGPSFTITLTLNNEGRCKLRVNDTELRSCLGGVENQEQLSCRAVSSPDGSTWNEASRHCRGAHHPHDWLSPAAVWDPVPRPRSKLLRSTPQASHHQALGKKDSRPSDTKSSSTRPCLQP